MTFGLYLHIPFCRHRCAYCDFNTYAGLEALVDPYMDALCREVHSLAGRVPGAVATVYLGGGTPSLVPLPRLSGLLEAVHASFEVLPDAELTLEANPGTVSADYLRGLREMGVNRLSMGMQSASPEDLRVLEREHDYFDVVRAMTWARKAGFDNVNIDLIFGLPFQDLARWERTLDLAVGLNPDHLSVYSLIFENGTPMNAWLERGLLPAPDDDLAADMYEHAQERLGAEGFEQYEISNWSKPGKTCRHNLQYWRSLPYLGLGAGAHGCAGGFRTVNSRAPKTYIERLAADAQRDFPRTAATASASPVTRDEEMRVRMMMGLRLVVEGVSDRDFHARFGVRLGEAFPDEIRGLVDMGLLEWCADTLRLSQRGVLLANRVFLEFV